MTYSIGKHGGNGTAMNDNTSRVIRTWENGKRKIVILPPEKHGEEWGTA